MLENRYFAVAARGIEPITALELERLGASNVEVGRGGVYFGGGPEMLYKANLWLRTATRIYQPLRDFAAHHRQMLYDQVQRVHWEDLLTPEMTFAIDCTISGAGKGGGSRLGEREGAGGPARERFKDAGEGFGGDERGGKGLVHSHYVSQKIKDAIVDRLRTKYGARPNVDTENPDLLIHAYIHRSERAEANNRCILSLDSTGGSLHERGYRVRDVAAPLKETLAAAILELTEWDGESPFIDPMCGSGTLPIEAALKALNIAPGLGRERFGFMGWPDFDEKLWEQLREQAFDAQKPKLYQPIVGYDRDRKAVTAALENRGMAGLDKNVHFEVRELDEMAPVGTKPGVVVMNPPYGERIGADNGIAELYERIGDLFKQRMKGWRGYIFTGNLEMAKKVGLKASRRFELFNGPLECRLLKYELY